MGHTDLRSRHRIPYGYRIENGVAVVDQQEATVLKHYFEYFLAGLPMAQAAKKAKLPCSATSLRNYLRKKEFIGTDYYPPIITEEYQRKLITEYEERKGKRIQNAPTHVKRGVRIYKEFYLERIKAYRSGDPVECVAYLYQNIRPKRNKRQ